MRMSHFSIDTYPVYVITYIIGANLNFFLYLYFDKKFRGVLQVER